jgi:hypothetical protein
MRTSLLLNLVLVSITALSQSAADHPNFAGVWKIDATNSIFRTKHPDTNVILKIKQTADKVEIDAPAVPGRNGLLELLPDGKQHVAHTDEVSIIYAIAEWRGEKLSVSFATEHRQARRLTPDKWTSLYSLSDDGKRLIEDQHVTASRFGAYDQHFEFIRR